MKLKLIKTIRKISFLAVILALGIFSCKNQKTNHVQEADVIIYGGTSAAVTAAVEVAQSGKSVIMVSPDEHLGVIKISRRNAIKRTLLTTAGATISGTFTNKSFINLL